MEGVLANTEMRFCQLCTNFNPGRMFNNKRLLLCVTFCS
jgi:hypothetical protein